MAGFTTDYSDVNDFELVLPGEYEVIIKKSEEHTTPKGAMGLNFTLVIRNDVEQKYQNRCIFHTLWKRHEPTKADMQVQGYSFKQVMQVAKAAALPSGKSYETVHELCADLVGRVIRVTISHKEFNGRTSEEVKYINVTKFPECKHVYKEKTVVTSDTIIQRPDEQFADTSGIGSLDEFEEIIGDGDVPF